MDLQVEHRNLPDLNLEQAFLVYQASKGGEALVTQHRVKDHRVLPGGFVEPPAFIPQPHAYWFQPGDVYRDNRTYVFITPAVRRRVYYAKGVVDKTSGRREHHPQYMWAVRDGSLHVWRFRRHGNDYILLSPRLWNVNEVGSVCLGTVPPPKLSEGRKAMEDFWESAFSHPLAHKHEWKGRLSEWLEK